MTKHEKKVLEALNTIVDKKRKVRDATKDEHEKERLNTEIIYYAFTKTSDKLKIKAVLSGYTGLWRY